MCHLAVPTFFSILQTGSGKTYTMGTGFDIATSEEEEGIIPRAVTHLFEGIDQRKSDAKHRNEPLPDFKITVQFMEVGNTVATLLKIFLVQKWHRMLKIVPNFHDIKKRNNNYYHKASSVRDLLKLLYLAKLYSMVYIYFYECP